MGINDKLGPAKQRKQKDHNGRLFVRETAQTVWYLPPGLPFLFAPLSHTSVFTWSERNPRLLEISLEIPLGVLADWLDL